MSKRIHRVLAGWVVLFTSLTACQTQQLPPSHSQPSTSTRLITPALSLPDQAEPTQYALNNEKERRQQVTAVTQQPQPTDTTETPKNPIQPVAQLPTPAAILTGDLPTPKNHQGALKP